jgi:zinc/manganese transport system substrate-binding protein
MRIALGLLTALAATSAQAVQVFACEPEWAALAKELGGDAVEVYTATTALQDVHQIQARPSLIAKARSADLLICTGAELEIGWLPMVLRQASNGRIQPGKPGHLEVYTAVEMLDIPTQVDRTAGDVHPYGNPHIQTDPHNITRIAPLITARLKAIEPARTATWERNLAAFQVKWQAALTRWTEQARPLAGAEFVAHHKSWPYLERWLGVRMVGYLEPKPGIPPPTGHLVSLLKQIDGAPVRGVIRSAYEDARPSEWLATRARLRAVVLPQTVGATPAAKDLFGLYDAILTELLALNP